MNTLHDTATGLFGANIPITGILGDRTIICAIWWNLVLKPVTAKNTIVQAVSCCLIPALKFNIVKINYSRHWRGKHKTKPIMPLEGSVFMAGAIVQWLRDGLGIIQKSNDVERLACQVEHTDGVVLVPAFTGLGAPHWDSDARALLCGMSRGTR